MLSSRPWLAIRKWVHHPRHQPSNIRFPKLFLHNNSSSSELLIPLGSGAPWRCLLCSHSTPATKSYLRMQEIHKATSKHHFVIVADSSLFRLKLRGRSYCRLTSIWWPRRPARSSIAHRGSQFMQKCQQENTSCNVSAPFEQ